MRSASIADVVIAVTGANTTILRAADITLAAQFSPPLWPGQARHDALALGGKLLSCADQYPDREHDGPAQHDLEHRLQERRVHVARADEGDRP